MLQPLRHFQDLVKVELQAVADATTKAVVQLEGEAASKGPPQSTILSKQLVEQLGKGLARYRQRIVDIWTTDVHPHLASLSDAERADSIDVGLRALEASFARMEGIWSGCVKSDQATTNTALSAFRDIARGEWLLLQAELSRQATTPQPSRPSSS